MKGKAIIKGVLACYNVSAAEFFGRSRAPYLKQVRLVAMQQMSAAGLRTVAIARLMQRDESTIFYWLNHDEVAERRTVYYAKRWAERREAEGRSPRSYKTTIEQRDRLVYLYRTKQLSVVKEMQRALGLNRKYTERLSASRGDAKSRGRLKKCPIGPVLPIGPTGIRWTHPEARL
jgi:hypothetical protein